MYTYIGYIALGSFGYLDCFLFCHSKKSDNASVQLGGEPDWFRHRGWGSAKGLMLPSHWQKDDSKRSF